MKAKQQVVGKSQGWACADAVCSAVVVQTPPPKRCPKCRAVGTLKVPVEVWFGESTPPTTKTRKSRPVT